MSVNLLLSSTVRNNLIEEHSDCQQVYVKKLGVVVMLILGVFKTNIP